MIKKKECESMRNKIREYEKIIEDERYKTMFL
jgi:hypothetical protein